MSWTGENKNDISKAEMVLQVGRTPTALLAAASAYYAGVGTCVARFRTKPWKLLLLVRAWRWSRRALQLADEARLGARIEGKQVPAYDFTFDQIDVICTIWYRFGSAQQKLWGKELLLFAAQRMDPRAASVHTLAFIALHRVRYGLDCWSDDVHDRVLSSALKVARDARDGKTDKLSGFGQASRIMRQLATMMPKADTRRNRHLEMATVYAKQGGATDQLVKLH